FAATGVTRAAPSAVASFGTVVQPVEGGPYPDVRRVDDHRHHPHRDRAAPVRGPDARAICLSARAFFATIRRDPPLSTPRGLPAGGRSCKPGARRLLLDVARAADAVAR